MENILNHLLKAPDSQLDKSIIDRLKASKDKPKEEFKKELMHCIDDCVCYSLASGFALSSLHIIHECFLDGKLEDFTDENCPWRKQYQ